MTAWAEEADVAKRMRRALDDAEKAAVPGLVESAQVLVQGYIGVADTAYNPPAAVPLAVRVVTSEMVARVLRRASQYGDTNVGVQQASQSAGVFSQQTAFTAGTNTGGPWLERTDKISLRRSNLRVLAFTIDTAPGATESSSEG